MAMTSSTDVIGSLAKTAEDAALVLEVIAGPDGYDATAAAESIPDYQKRAFAGYQGLENRIAGRIFLRLDLDPDVKKMIMAAVKELEGQGRK